MTLSYFNNRITWVFVFLVGITSLSWSVGHGLGLSDVRYVNSVVIAIAFIKVRYVFLEFMEVRHAPAWLRRLSEAWIICVCVGLLLLYWIGTSSEITQDWPSIQGLSWPYAG